MGDLDPSSYVTQSELQSALSTALQQHEEALERHETALKNQADSLEAHEKTLEESSSAISEMNGKVSTLEEELNKLMEKFKEVEVSHWKIQNKIFVFSLRFEPRQVWEKYLM